MKRGDVQGMRRELVNLLDPPFPHWSSALGLTEAEDILSMED